MRDLRRTLRLTLTAVAASLTMIGAARAEGPVVALSNSFYGNIWRHQMVDAFVAAAEKAKSEGLIGDYIVLNGDGSVPQQAAQMSDLILRHPDVITINAASETALNGVIQKACAAGIKVIAFDSLASAPCATKVDFDFKTYPTEIAEWVAKQLGGKGNILFVRGVKGSAPDEQSFGAQMEVFKKYPDIKIVGELFGQASISISQQAIANALPSLPHIDAVMAAGEGDFGAVQAFRQFGGPYAEKMPIIPGGNSSNFMKWWAEENAKNQYTTISANTTPGIGGAVLWLAVEALSGKTLPAHMVMPVAKVTQDELSKYADLKPGELVSPSYSREWVDANLLTQNGE